MQQLTNDSTVLSINSAAFLVVSANPFAPPSANHATQTSDRPTAQHN